MIQITGCLTFLHISEYSIWYSKTQHAYRSQESDVLYAGFNVQCSATKFLLQVELGYTRHSATREEIVFIQYKNKANQSSVLMRTIQGEIQFVLQAM